MIFDIEPLDKIKSDVESLVDRDYIVSQGTYEGWTYRKWNSGIAECWTMSTVIVWINNQTGNCYYGDSAEITLPFTFKAAPSVTANMSQTSTTTAWMSVIRITKSAFTARLFRGAAVANDDTYRYSAYVVGKWK